MTQRRFRVVTTDSNHSLPVADNLLDQTFLATRPNEIWLADITYIPTDEGWLYLATVLDLFTRKVVGWAMRDHTRLILNTLALLFARILTALLGPAAKPDTWPRIPSIQNSIA